MAQGINHIGDKLHVMSNSKEWLYIYGNTAQDVIHLYSIDNLI
jgi:hypothetical protein